MHITDTAGIAVIAAAIIATAAVTSAGIIVHMPAIIAMATDITTAAHTGAFLIVRRIRYTTDKKHNV